MLHSYSSTQPGHDNHLQRRVFSPSKLSSPSHPRVFLGLHLHPHIFVKLRYHPLSCTLLPLRQTVNSHPSKRIPKPPRVSLGFKLHGGPSSTAVLPANGRKKNKYGGALPSILRSLDADADIERTLSSVSHKLNPKEQTVILKEQSRWERVVKVFEFFKSQKEYLPNVIHYNIVLRSLGRAERWDELRLCWIEMATKGVLPTNNTYGMLVDVYGKAGLGKEALLWIKHMRLRGIFPDEVTMNTVVRVLKEAGEYDRADRFFKDWCLGRVELDDLEMDSSADFGNISGSTPMSFKHFLSTELFRIGGRNPISKNMRSEGTESCVRKPRLSSTYNTLIDLYGKAGRLKDAANVFAEMLKAGVAVDTFTFNTMIFTCGSHGQLSEAESLFAKMEERGISPDTKTYNILLSLYADAGNIDGALRCYKRIREVGLLPDVVTHRAVLHILCKNHMVKEVEAVIAELERYRLRMDEHSVPAVVRMFVSEGLLDRAQVVLEKYQLDRVLSSKSLAAVIDVYAEKGMWAEAEAVFYGKRDQVDILEYNVMVKAYGMAKLYEKAFSLFKSMKNQGTWPDACTYNSLVQMFAGGDVVDQARDLLTEMQRAGFKPKCQTFSAVISSFVRLGQLSSAIDVYQEMNKAKVKANEVVFGSLINGFAENGDVEEALQYFRLMQECGISANQIVMTSLIKAYSKIGCFEGARNLYEKIKESEGGPDIIAANSMLSLYADLSMVSEAKVVFDSLRVKGISDGITFATMIYLYKSMGMLDEAIDVAEEMKQSGLLRDCASYNKIMACYATNGQLRECGDLLHEMITNKLLPDIGTFNVLFTLLKKGGIPSEAVRQLESAYNEGKPYARQAVFATLYSVVGLHAFALESCDAFLKAEVALDSFVYNATIYVYGSSGEINKALNMYMKIQDQGLKPDVVTYIYLVGCYAKAGMVEGVKRIYSRLKYGEIESSESLFKAVINAYRVANKLDLAELVRQEMRFVLDPEKSSEDEFSSEDFESSDLYG